MPFQFLLQLIEIGCAEAVQDGHESVLMKIRHGPSRTGFERIENSVKTGGIWRSQSETQRVPTTER
jgi:hypothetical protein